MFRVFIGFVVLLLAVWLGITVQAHPGYLLMAYGDWSVETTLWFAIIAIVVFLLIVYILVKLLDYLLSISGRLHNWASKRRLRKSQQLTNLGLCELAEGDWLRAERHLVKGAITKDTALINFLAAARAAQGQAEYNRRDDYLRRAHHANPKAQMAIGLTQAELQLDAEQLEQALATLKHLRELKPNHAHVLKLLQKVYVALNDWPALKELLPELKKHKAVKAGELDKLSYHLHSHLLTKAIDNDFQVEQTWQAQPKDFQQDKRALIQYTNYLIANDNAEAAEPLLASAIKKSWSQQLVYQYSNTRSANPAKQLAKAEYWLKKHADDPVLLLTLAKLCKQYQLWGKAKDYAEKSLHLDPRSETDKLINELNIQLEQDA